MASLAEVQAMSRALELATSGSVPVFPNPMVGAVVFDKAGDIVGEGFHGFCGGPHAETVALDRAGDSSTGGILVVTLEPCCHYGRTAPCTSAILRAGLGRVVIAMEDPDPRVSGGGVRMLREAGLQVETGVLREEAESMNRVYLHYRRTGRSWLRLKLAVSMDGRLAPADGGGGRFTCRESMVAVHRMRAGSAAVLTGAGTVRSDDPRLTVRLAEQGLGAQPVRIVVTRSGDLGTSANIFSGEARTVVAVPEGLPREITAGLEDRGLEVWRLPDSPEGGPDLRSLLAGTAEEGMGEVLAECGSRLATSLLREQLVNSMAVFTAPILLGSGGLPAVGDLGIGSMAGALRLRDTRASASGSDTLLEGEVVYRAD